MTRSTGAVRPEIVLGVGGGIAAYKACELLRRFTESGHAVTVAPTASALQFVGEATWAALSGRRASHTVWQDAHEVPHVRIGQRADLVVVAPATADVLARAAHGRADDLLTNTLLTARCPVVFAPAMHTEMWEHPATRENVALLRDRGAIVIEPASGRLTGSDTGKGRLPDPAEIFAVCRRVLARGERAGERDLAGRRVVISAGGTREPLDPVRFLGNHSSGKQGYALARAAVARGAQVTLVAANTALPDPAGATVVPVSTTRELAEAVTEAARGADVVVMAAAVADFRPVRVATGKIKKRDGVDPEPIALERNPDILAGLAAPGADRPAVVVGFAAETDDVLASGRAKLARKGCDLLVVNEVGGGRAFGTEDNEAVLLDARGGERHVPYGPKDVLADAVWDAVAAEPALS
ncbi:bifunctional phosphopantothenoylcysteine decarboxylase/phosphopantothenate--cysteine ligase CoaBC [Streptomyces bohaiensis]|uniref:Coenzyme A biosynthesis bifunctional protein CoaBC n=1 Tax=Streptomyces bohaiensis TaxID=1431344 RepID=A0ABX1C571_9ACTN|nr:bifunctional phosphopantothenoylcysteine decarboxylase/phosphopantothenate--cysteine ligase CoaBC [Streptomyces bohaiensis]NJQ14361.1 bifunctional phosphopantothenoylcysteine decarboxylase/phosphopantothenate--cysteine ligase CoaBC [Streptomyces bohaiensis]